MSTISASEARQTLPAQLDAVERGDEVRITRHGRVVAVLVSPGAVPARRAASAFEAAARLALELEAARGVPLPPPTMSVGRGEALIDEIRTGRDGR